MIPKAFVFVEKYPNLTGTELNEKMKTKNRVGQYICQANKSNYSRKTGEKIINAGKGYILRSKAKPVDKVDSTRAKLNFALNILANSTTQEISCDAQIEATQLYFEYIPKLIEGIGEAIKNIVTSPTKEEQIKILEKRLQILKKEDTPCLNG